MRPANDTMRFRLLRRRLTISAPRMLVRSAFPWPFRWAVLAIVLGFCAAIGLWAFEFGKDIAGIDGGAKEELVRVREELSALRLEVSGAKEARDKAQAIADTAGTLVTAAKAAHMALLTQSKQLEGENRQLKEDLGFFEKLIPSSGGEGLTIRGLQAEVVNGRQVKWQVVVMQSLKNSAEFSATLEVSFTGTLNGKPWSAALPSGSQAIKIRQYGRTEGVFDVPAQVTVKSIAVRVFQGGVVKASQSARV